MTRQFARGIRFGMALLLLATAATVASTAPRMPAQTDRGNRICVSGWLTQKGSAPGEFWAITSAQGIVWQIVDRGSIETKAIAAATNRRVIADAMRVEGGLFPQLRLLAFRRKPCP